MEDASGLVCIFCSIEPRLQSTVGMGILSHYAFLPSGEMMRRRARGIVEGRTETRRDASSLGQIFFGSSARKGPWIKVGIAPLTRSLAARP